MTCRKLWTQRRMTKMKITYAKGTVVEALLLSRGVDTLRAVAISDDDARTFALIGETWISEECEPVQIEFAWSECGGDKVLSEADCICSQAFSSRLVSMLVAGSNDDDANLDVWSGNFRPALSCLAENSHLVM